MMRLSLAVLMLLTACTQLPKENKMNEKYLYLEEVQGKQSVDFAKELSKKTTDKFQSDPRFKAMKTDILDNLNDPEKIPYGQIHGDFVYNFWKDAKHTRGLWRRAKLADYLENKNQWETLIDLDALAKREGKNWVWKGASLEESKNRLAIISLSIGGKDASFKREFDTEKKRFVKNGFNIEVEGKNWLTWINENEIMIKVDLGPETLTKAGYPRQLRLWKRGEDYKKSKLIFNLPEDQAFAWPWYDHLTNKTIIIVSPEWYKNEYYAYNEKTFEMTKFPLPQFMEIENRIDGQLIGTTREEWKTFKPGDIISFNEAKLEKGEVDAQLVFRPEMSQAVQHVYGTKDKAYVSLLHDVKEEVYSLTYANGQWKMEKIELPNELGRTSFQSTDKSRKDFFISQEGFLQPESLYYYDGDQFKLVRKQKSLFNTDNLKVEQYFAKSKDGTSVPYFQVSKNDLVLNGNNPTEVYAYGGFQHAMLPFYPRAMGKYWLQKGGVYVLANIRGGSEYGARWHKQALKEKRQNAYDDFFAVAEDLIRRKVSSPEKLAVKGGSNGGLLTTVALTQRPDLYSAVISHVPLTDMERFHKLLAGHSWVGEYGDPDKKEEKEFLLKYSPFHQLKKETDYPTPYISTSMLDDRVHPAHARKFVAKMKDLGHDVYYYENMEGGHAGASNFDQWATNMTMEYLYLYERLGMNNE